MPQIGTEAWDQQMKKELHNILTPNFGEDNTGVQPHVSHWVSPDGRVHDYLDARTHTLIPQGSLPINHTQLPTPDFIAGSGVPLPQLPTIPEGQSADDHFGPGGGSFPGPSHPGSSGEGGLALKIGLPNLSGI